MESGNTSTLTAATRILRRGSARAGLDGRSARWEHERKVEEAVLVSLRLMRQHSFDYATPEPARVTSSRTHRTMRIRSGHVCGSGRAHAAGPQVGERSRHGCKWNPCGTPPSSSFKCWRCQCECARPSRYFERIPCKTIVQMRSLGRPTALLVDAALLAGRPGDPRSPCSIAH
ncbi:hypothetical protein DFH07DRAFT_811276 [Mycena maculata]|uniref:Uncharacterized protein n=1 Tax=Mycena maculata TaxID=230809 RepID=A0AAD7NK34_9AGAR|nr:hypothetical protein DFH07DRAFT_811276 [Mycena maculata]